MNYNLMSPKRQVGQGAAAGAVQGAQCNCMACQRSRCESSVSTWDLGRQQKQEQQVNQQAQAETAPDLPLLPPGLLALKRELDPMVWQEVLKQRALRLVEEEMRERAAARLVHVVAHPAAVADAKDGQTEALGNEAAGLDLDVESLIRKLPNPDAPLKRAGFAGPAGEPLQEQRQTPTYKLVGETETQRFYKAEAQDPAEPMSPVTAEFKVQHAAMDCLGEGLERLEDRLQAVLRGNSTGWPAPEDPTAVDTPLMLDLRHVSNRLQVMVQRLNELAARVIL